nr:MAG TPA: hypothetical protein [Caudoviricetes sp.]
MMSLKSFRYWLRINHYRSNQFGTGLKNNPIKNVIRLIKSIKPITD